MGAGSEKAPSILKTFQLQRFHGLLLQVSSEKHWKWKRKSDGITTVLVKGSRVTQKNVSVKTCYLPRYSIVESVSAEEGRSPCFCFREGVHV